jgi:hypothetical protein
MPSPDFPSANPDYRDMLSALNAEGAEYLVVGAYAVASHGLPRATRDLDVWVRATPGNASRVFRALAAFGAPLEGVSIRDFEVEGSVFQIGVEPQRVDVLTRITAVTFDDAWPRRILADVEGVRVPVIGRAELLRNKRAVGRPQDLADAARLEKVP